MSRIRQIMLQWAIQHGPTVLPTLAAATLALLLASYAAEQVDGQPTPDGWAGYISRYVPEWLSKGLLICLITGWGAFVAYQIAKKYPAGANLATVAGSMIVAALTWATQWCSTAGGIAAGLLIGAIVFGIVYIRPGARRQLWQTLVGWWPDSESKQASLGTIQFAQIGMALYFGAIALMAISGSVPAELRWKVLAFAGIGITAAAVLSYSRKLSNWLAMLGGGIGLWGAYVEMNRAAVIVGGEVNAATIMLVAGVLIYGPLAALALEASTIVRRVIAPLLVAGLATGATFVVTVMVAVFISTGCNLEAALVAALILGGTAISIVVGAAAFLILTAIEIVNWLRRRKRPGNSEHE